MHYPIAAFKEQQSALRVNKEECWSRSQGSCSRPVQSLPGGAKLDQSSQERERPRGGPVSRGSALTMPRPTHSAGIRMNDLGRIRHPTGHSSFSGFVSQPRESGRFLFPPAPGSGRAQVAAWEISDARGCHRQKPLRIDRCRSAAQGALCCWVSPWWWGPEETSSVGVRIRKEIP